MRDHDPRGLHEHLRCGSRSNRKGPPVAPSQPHAVGRVVTSLDLDDLSGLELVTLDEPEELGILIADALDCHRGVKRAGEERVVARPADRAVRVRNRIAVRVDRRPPKHFVDPVDQSFRHGMAIHRAVRER